MTHVCLFDIDGTILNSGSAGKTAMVQAFADEFQVDALFEGLQTAGRTDRAIAHDIFNHHQHELNEEKFQQFVTTYKRLLPEHLSQSNGMILPGVEKLIQVLHSREDIDLGLLTGNYRDGARLKLSHYDFYHYFEFGGFGDVHLHRDDVAKEALEVIHQRHDEDFDRKRIWVIGDTPADVQCGRAINAQVVAVATGTFSYEELEKTEPDYLFHDFSDYQKFIALLD
jgi:phosphoglycolate phosphatase